MVASGVFVLLMVSTIFFYDLSQRSNRKASVHSEAYREAALALRHIRRELKGANILYMGPGEPDPLPPLKVGQNGARILYSTPKWKDGRIVVDHRGNPEWDTEHELVVELDGTLRVGKRPVGSPSGTSFDTEQRPLARLGQDEVSFELVGEQLLEVTIVAVSSDDFKSEGNTSRRELTMKVGLANKQFWRDLKILTKK
jgi:hypothetical protein